MMPRRRKSKKFADMADADLDKLIAGKEAEMEKAETRFRDEVQKLQDAYSKLSTDKDAKLEESRIRVLVS
jgi:Skp family chaperone for outer membrane proteins